MLSVYICKRRDLYVTRPSEKRDLYVCVVYKCEKRPLHVRHEQYIDLGDLYVSKDRPLLACKCKKEPYE